jgi:putative transposase
VLERQVRERERGALRDEGRGEGKGTGAWGGRRAGAGRKRQREHLHVPHRIRAPHGRRFPVHVSMKAVAGLPSFRCESVRKALHRAIWAAQRVGAFRIVHFSIQRNHLHLIVEAEGGVALSRGVQGFAVRVARAINRHLSRSGEVWAHRYFARDLRSERQVRTALVYVLQNHKKSARSELAMDLYSSAPLFDGWEACRETDFLRWRALELTGLGSRDGPRAGVSPGLVVSPAWPVVAPATWLAREGWLRAGGLIGLEERPRREDRS